MMIFSVHMPKCGGTSFSVLLKNYFGWKIAIDHDYPIHYADAERARQAKQARKWVRFKYKYLFQYRFKQCIHGHFLPYKYADFYGTSDHIFITWLRDPIDRLISHYDFWMRTYQQTRKPKPLHRKVVEEGWSLKEFAFSEELQNFYAKFLWEFPAQQFDFIGITEHYEEDLQYFARKYLGLTNVTMPQKNVSPERSGPGIKDPEVLNELRAFHARDYEIYNYAVENRPAHDNL